MGQIFFLERILFTQRSYSIHNSASTSTLPLRLTTYCQESKQPHYLHYIKHSSSPTEQSTCSSYPTNSILNTRRSIFKMATPSEIARQGGCLYCTDDSYDGISPSCTGNQLNWASAAQSNSGHAQNDAPSASNSQNQQLATQSSHDHGSDGSISDSYSMIEMPTAHSSDNDNNSDDISDSYSLVEEQTQPHDSNGTPADHANPANPKPSTSSSAAPALSVEALIEENEDLKLQIKWLWQEDRHTRDKYEEHHFPPNKKMRKLETKNKKLEVEIEGLEYENEGLKEENSKLEDENQALWDKKGEIEEDIAYLRRSRREKDAETKAKIEKLEQEKEQFVQEAQAKIKALENSYQTTIRDLQTERDYLQEENAKLHKQRNQDMRHHVADSDIARDNIAYIIKLEGAYVELRNDKEELRQQLQKEQLDNFQTRQVGLSRLEELQGQRVSHRKEIAGLHKKLDNYEAKHSNAITELMEQDDTIRTLRRELDRQRKEAAEYSTASRRVFKDQERNARKLRDENENLRQQLQDIGKAQGERNDSTRTFLELSQFVQTPPLDSDTEGSTEEQDNGRNLGSWTQLRACNGKSRRESIYPSQLDSDEDA